MPTGRWSFDINAFGIGWIEINLAGGTTWVWVTRPSWWGYFVGWINIEDHWCYPELHLSECQFSWSGDITVDSSKCSLLIVWYWIEICRHIPRKCLFLSRTMAENVQQSHQKRRWCEVTVSWKLATCMLNRFVSNFLSQSTSWNHIWLPCQWVNGKSLFTLYWYILYIYIIESTWIQTVIFYMFPCNQPSPLFLWTRTWNHDGIVSIVQWIWFDQRLSQSAVCRTPTSCEVSIHFHHDHFHRGCHGQWIGCGGDADAMWEYVWVLFFVVK